MRYLPAIHPAYVHAFEQCGFLLTDANKHLFPEEDIARWEAAIDEWVAANPDIEAPNGANGAA